MVERGVGLGVGLLEEVLGVGGVAGRAHGRGVQAGRGRQGLPLEAGPAARRWSPWRRRPRRSGCPRGGGGGGHRVPAYPGPAGAEVSITTQGDLRGAVRGRGGQRRPVHAPVGSPPQRRGSRSTIAAATPVGRPPDRVPTGDDVEGRPGRQHGGHLVGASRRGSVVPWTTCTGMPCAAGWASSAARDSGASRAGAAGRRGDDGSRPDLGGRCGRRPGPRAAPADDERRVRGAGRRPRGPAARRGPGRCRGGPTRRSATRQGWSTSTTYHPAAPRRPGWRGRRGSTAAAGPWPSTRVPPDAAGSVVVVRVPRGVHSRRSVTRRAPRRSSGRRPRRAPRGGTGSRERGPFDRLLLTALETG